MIYVQGDTTTTLGGALAAFYARIPVGHVEAGLRTGDLMQPFPEEMNRVVTGRLAALHLAATEGGRANLRREGIDADAIHVTGNSGIDAVLYVRDRLVSGALPGGDWSFLDPDKRLIVVTAHRRETSIGFAMGLIVAVAYFLFVIIGDTLRGNPHVHPELLVWFPNVLFIILGCLLFRRLARQ